MQSTQITNTPDEALGVFRGAIKPSGRKEDVELAQLTFEEGIPEFLMELGRSDIVPTPIGNLGDITERSKVLSSCDLILAEETQGLLETYLDTWALTSLA